MSRGGWKGPVLTDEQYVAKWKASCKIDENGCWLWQKFIQPVTGYADTSYRGKQIRAHRAMHMAAKGPIPDGLQVLHSCDVRHCINPDHLRVGTMAANAQDAIDRGRHWRSNRTVCPKGHSYAEHGVRHGETQWRHCKICARARARMRAGWPEDLAYSIDPIPRGKLTDLSTRWERRGGNKPDEKSRG